MSNFLSNIEQTIEPTKSIIFEDNIDHITIMESGIYIINFSGHFTDNCQLILFINNYPELSTLFFSKSGLVSIYQILKLKENDKISIRNNSLSTSIKTILYNKSNNLNLDIIKI